MRFRFGLIALVLLPLSPHDLLAAAGTEGASFLDIPVGAAPAALGSAYTAQAGDVYAPVWNPAGLGFLHSVEMDAMGLNYISPVNAGHLGLVVPMGPKEDEGTAPGGLGASIQYFGTGNIDAFNQTGQPQGSFSATFAAYSLAYGMKLSDALSLGTTAKIITEKIADATGNSYAADVGMMYRPVPQLSLGLVGANLGPEIKLADDSDPLPMAGRLGALYQLFPNWDLSAETVYRKTGLASAGFGVEWRYGDLFSFRGGYNTAHTKELGFGSGITAGLGVFLWGQEVSYAWVPMGDLGQTHYLSLVFRGSAGNRPERPRLAPPKSEDTFGDSTTNTKTNTGMQQDNRHGYENIFDILEPDEKKAAQ